MRHKKKKERIKEHNIRRVLSILEGHQWDSNMVCMKCGYSIMELDVFKSRNNLEYLSCKEVIILKERKERERSWIRKND